MNPDLYGAWLTAGDRLQPVGAWLAGHWTGLVSLAVAIAALYVVWWAIRDDCQPRRNDQGAARRFEERPEPAEPGTNEDDLLTCLQILAATNARKEKP